MRVTNTDQFIAASIKVHGSKYNYSEVEYILSNVPVKIVCPDHGMFFQRPGGHLSGYGCPVCAVDRTAKAKSITQEEFLNRARKKHGDKYDYSLVIIKKCREKVDIICPNHGMFKQPLAEHMSGSRCPKCAREVRAHKARMTTESFIEKATKVHEGKYNYSLVDYIESSSKVKIICPKHGLFEQTPNNHLMGMKCIKCSTEQTADKRRSNTEEFISKAKRVHGNKYDYSKVCYVDNSTKIIVICPNHGDFTQAPSAHLNKRGCPICCESRGERKIVLFLESEGIPYQKQKKFDTCRYKRKLSFDFFVPDYNACIEFDGRQHFFPSVYFGGMPEFERTKKVDWIKNQFCLNNGIKLIRVSYRVKNIDSFLKKELCIC